MALNAGDVEAGINAVGFDAFAKQLGAASAALGQFESRLKGVGKEEKDTENATLGLMGAMKALGAMASVHLAESLAESAFQAGQAIRVFEGLGGSMDHLREKTLGMISDADLAKKANLAQTMGINPKDFEQMAMIAKAAAAKTGQSVDHMFDSIVTGTARQSKLILDNLGIMVNADQANAKYAKTIGSSAAALNDVQKKQAFTNEVIAKGTVVLKELEATGVSLVNPFSQMHAATANAATAVGTVLIPAFTKLASVLVPVLDAVASGAKTFGTLNTQTRIAAVALAGLSVATLVYLSSIKAGTPLLSALGASFTELGKAAAAAASRLWAFMVPLLQILAVVGAVVVAVAVMHAAWTENWGGIQEKAASAWSSIQKGTRTAVTNVVAAFYYIKDAATYAFAQAGNAILTGIGDPIGTVGRMFNWLRGIWDTVTRYLSDAVSGVGKAIVAKVVDPILGGFAMVKDYLSGMSLEGVVKKYEAFADAVDAKFAAVDFQGMAEKAAIATDAMLTGLADAMSRGLDASANVKPPNWDKAVADATSALDAASAFASDTLSTTGKKLVEMWGQLKQVGGDAAKTFIDFIAKHWGEIAKELGFGFDEKQAVKAGKVMGQAAGEELSDAMKKARATFAEALQGLRERDAVGAFQDPFRGIAQVAMDTAKELRGLQEKATAAGMGMDEARTLVNRNAGRELAARVNGVTNLMEWNQAVGMATREALNMGVKLQDVTDNVKFKPTDMGDVMTQRVSQVFDAIASAMGSSVAQGDRKTIVETISKGIADLLKGGDLNLEGVGSALGQLIGGSKAGSDILSGLFGVGGSAGPNTGARGQVASVGALMGPAGLLAAGGQMGGAGSAVSALAGGSAGAAGGPMGAAAGAAVMGVLSAVIPLVVDAIKNLAEKILEAAQVIPQLVSKAVGMLGELIPSDRIRGLLTQAFDPKVVFAAMGLGSLSILSSVLAPFAALMTAVVLPSLIGIALALSTLVPSMLALAVVVIPTLTAAALFMAASFVVGTAIVATGIAAAVTAVTSALGLLAAYVLVVSTLLSGGLNIALMFVAVPAILAASVVLGALALAAAALVATFVGTAALLVVFFKAALDTKSFEAFKRAFEAVGAKLTLALEPFFQGLMPLAGVFDALVAVLLPLAAGFAANAYASEVLFVGFKVLAIGLGVGIMAVGLFVSAILAGVYAFASGLSGLIKALPDLQNAINLTAKGILSAVAALADGLLRALGDALTDGQRQWLGGVRNNANDQLASGAFNNAAGDFTSALDAAAAAALTMSPNLDAMGAALADLTGLTYEEAMNRANILSAEKAMSEELTNVPEGFKVTAARFRAIAAQDFGTIGQPAAAGTAGQNFYIDRVDVGASNLAEFAGELSAEAERQTFQQTGTTGTRDGQNNGRN